MVVQFEPLFHQLPNAYMVLDRQLRYVEVNRAYEELTGHSRAQLLGRGVFEVFPGEVNEDGSSQSNVLRSSLQHVLETGERHVLALIPYAIASDPSEGRELEIRYWSASHEPIFDESANVVGVLQHTSDVTELERLREEVKRNRTGAVRTTGDQLTHGVLSRAATVQQDNLRLSARHSFLVDLFEQAPGFMAVLRGPGHVFELANDAYVALVGGRHVLGKPLCDALPEIAGQGIGDLLDEVRSTGVPYIGRAVAVQLHDADGATATRYVDFIYQPIRDSSGSVDGIFVQGADVTAREVALARVSESESRFRTIAELVPQMVWSTQPDGYHDYYNQRSYEFTGVPQGSTDGDAWNGMFHPEDQAEAWARWRHSLATGEPYQIEYRLRDQLGRYQWVLGRALPVRDPQGRIVRWIGTCTEIDEIKTVQRELENTQAALRAADGQKDRFLATIAHELRNPLSAIATASQLLAMGPERTEMVLQAAGIIDRQATQMKRLIEDLLDVSRVTRGQVALQTRWVRVAELVHAAVEQCMPLLAQRGHRLEFVDTAPGLALAADPIRLTQVLANLLNNAAKYTSMGGRVTVTVGRDADDAWVRVCDNGVGMDAALIDRAFDLFAQAHVTPERHEGGLGVGLALARSLAQLHGGRLTASSDGPGHGSTFELRVPCKAEALAPA